MNITHKIDHSTDSQDMPLGDLTVLDLGQAYQGPYAGLLLAKAGARVIRIESLRGDSTRARAKVRPGALLPNAMLNANKKSIALDLKTAEGKALLIDMVKRADVLIENFAPGVMDRLGVGWQTLSPINERLVYASGTGFGLSGPDRDRLAMDIIIQAYSGVMSVTGFPDSQPLKTGIAVADFLGGTHLYGAIMTALYERTKTGKGRLVEVAMQEAIYPTLASSLGLVHGGASTPTRVGNQHSGLAVAPWSVYDAKDGHVTIVCVKDEHWHYLTEAMEQPALKDDPRFSNNVERVKNLEELDAAILSWTRERTRDEIVELARRHRFPAAPVRTLQEVMHDPGMHERGMLETILHPELGEAIVPGSPIRIHGAELPKTTPSPMLGQHTNEILHDWLGLDNAAIERLEALGAIYKRNPES